jgi:pSer/pThr/pTyr-binding forkhead associated (FHA) protein
MPEDQPPQQKKGITPDWLVRGVLTKLGDTFDRFTGRKWQPSSSLATSELIERLKKLLDSEAREAHTKTKFVPHNIQLKMQWNKFSTDSEAGMLALENELLTAAVDHINDNRYHTQKPLNIKIKPDYFTEGVRLLASFGEIGADDDEAEIKVTVPTINVKGMIPDTPAVAQPEPEDEKYIAQFRAKGKDMAVELDFGNGKRVSVGRTKDNDLAIEDPSISKVHASMRINQEGRLVVADTGSTNGTFINGERIAYGKAFVVGEDDKLKFGTVEVYMRKVPRRTDFGSAEQYQAPETAAAYEDLADISGGEEEKRDVVPQPDPQPQTSSTPPPTIQQNSVLSEPVVKAPDALYSPEKEPFSTEPQIKFDLEDDVK